MLLRDTRGQDQFVYLCCLPIRFCAEWLFIENSADSILIEGVVLVLTTVDPDEAVVYFVGRKPILHVWSTEQVGKSDQQPEDVVMTSD